MTVNQHLPENIRNILVIKLRNIGDVLLTSPLFANLRLRFPAARLCALVNSGTEAMLIGNPAIDKVHIYDRSVKDASFPRKVVRELSFMAELRKEKFDLVLNLTGGDRGAIVAYLSGAAVRVGSRSAGRGMKGKNRLFTHLVDGYMPELHTVEHNLHFLSPIGVPITETRVTFPLHSTALQSVDTLLAEAGIVSGDYFHAHLTSRWMFKTMPPEKAAQLIDLLASKTGLTAVFTASPEEKELAYLRRVLETSQATRLDLSGRLSLRQLGALSSRARFFAGVDSAPMHMAAALDIPVFAVFGPSSVVHWGPWDNRLAESPYRYCRGIQSTGQHLVLQSDRDCVPCHRDGCNGSKVSDCLDFDPEFMESAVVRFLNDNSGLLGTSPIVKCGDNA